MVTKNQALWGGRFKKATNGRVKAFNSSIAADQRMAGSDIRGSMAHAYMLGATGIIAPEESDKIIAALEGILADIESGKLEIDPAAEDIHMFVETVLTERIGETGKRLHTARSRNDQVALDIRMTLKREIDRMVQLTEDLIKTILAQAEANKATIMPGMTHLQHGQPITFAHHILAYAQMFKRDIERLKDCKKRTDIMPLGAGALAGTTYPIDRQMVADRLGFAEITENSIDSVGDRDFVIELASDLSVIMMHISRFSEEIILWCTTEFHYIELDDAFSTGSSIMPQKKNPDIAELCRGKAGRVYGTLVTLLTMMKNLPLAYNKDLQEDKEAIFDAIDNAAIALETFSGMLRTMTVNVDVMKAAAQKGFINATDCADYLVKRGMAFRDAYKIVGELVAYCIEKDYILETLPLEDYQAKSELFDEDIYQAIDLVTCVNQRKSYGGPSATSVDHQIARLRAFLA